jgi:hypothetical protein
MKIPRLLFVTGRLGFAFFILLTSTYCLLNFIPFTYHQINAGGLLPSVTTFVKIHPYLYWAALAAVALTLVPDLYNRKTKALTLTFLFFFGWVGAVLPFRPLLSGLGNNTRSLTWSLAVLVPLLWVSVIDWLGHAPLLAWAKSDAGEDRRVFWAAWQSALFLSFLYATILCARALFSKDIVPEGRERLLALTWSISAHLLIFMAIFVIVNFVRGVASLFDRNSKVEFLLCNLIVFFVVKEIFSFLIFPQISFGGPLAQFVALALATTLTAFSAGMSVRLYHVEEGPVDSGLSLLLAPLTFGRLAPWWWKIVCIILISATAYFLESRTATLDWNYLLQKLSALLVWAATFASFYSMARRANTKEGLSVVLLLVAAASLGAYKTLEASQTRWKILVNGKQRDIAGLLDSYAGYDVSFKLIRDLLSPVNRGDTFYTFLSENTNIPQSTRVDPVEVRLVENFAPSAGPKPNIFVFVIDSLRRDYLSPYNSSVTFTPSIDSFARESVVMENAFTRYGGTGLSEPSIWVGGMLVHKQYVAPFYPMNNLKKLVDTDGYQSYVSKDFVLNAIVGPWPSLIELDNGIGTMSYDFCSTLKELTGKLSQRSDSSRPIFVYTQPQNIHISVINREGQSVPPGESYPGFYAPYASRLRRIDGCFGGFVQYLKTTGLYDNSSIILTSDHGDSLGEDGRWGHAYTLFPEILRIPLIVHLPRALRVQLSYDARRVAFLADITPSLYYLLGHKPIIRDVVLGRPLFTAKAEEGVPYLQDSYLVVSSYGPVYGILKDNGRSLFVADGVNYQEYLYDSAQNPLDTSEPVTTALRTQYDELIRRDVFAINRFYKFGQQQ